MFPGRKGGASLSTSVPGPFPSSPDDWDGNMTSQPYLQGLLDGKLFCSPSAQRADARSTTILPPSPSRVYTVRPRSRTGRIRTFQWHLDPPPDRPTPSFQLCERTQTSPLVTIRTHHNTPPRTTHTGDTDGPVRSRSAASNSMAQLELSAAESKSQKLKQGDETLDVAIRDSHWNLLM